MENETSHRTTPIRRIPSIPKSLMPLRWKQLRNRGKRDDKSLLQDSFEGEKIQSAGPLKTKGRWSSRWGTTGKTTPKADRVHRETTSPPNWNVNEGGGVAPQEHRQTSSSDQDQPVSACRSLSSNTEVPTQNATSEKQVRDFFETTHNNNEANGNKGKLTGSDMKLCGSDSNLSREDVEMLMLCDKRMDVHDQARTVDRPNTIQHYAVEPYKRNPGVQREMDTTIYDLSHVQDSWRSVKEKCSAIEQSVQAMQMVQHNHVIDLNQKNLYWKNMVIEKDKQACIQLEFYTSLEATLQQTCAKLTQATQTIQDMNHALDCVKEEVQLLAGSAMTTSRCNRPDLQCTDADVRFCTMLYDIVEIVENMKAETEVKIAKLKEDNVKLSTRNEECTEKMKELNVEYDEHKNLMDKQLETLKISLVMEKIKFDKQLKESQKRSTELMAEVQMRDRKQQKLSKKYLLLEREHEHILRVIEDLKDEVGDKIIKINK